MQAILFDLDGVLYQGDVSLPGAAETVAWVRDQAIPHLFLTNTSSRPRAAIAEKLARLGIEPVVLGKPAPAFFDAAVAAVHGTPAGTLMIGDDIRGDVAGAQRAGLRAALVRTGKFRPADLHGDVRPDAVLDSVGDLPAWWEKHGR